MRSVFALCLTVALVHGNRFTHFGSDSLNEHLYLNKLGHGFGGSIGSSRGSLGLRSREFGLNGAVLGGSLDGSSDGVLGSSDGVLGSSGGVLGSSGGVVGGVLGDGFGGAVGAVVGGARGGVLGASLGVLGVRSGSGLGDVIGGSRGGILGGGIHGGLGLHHSGLYNGGNFVLDGPMAIDGDAFLDGRAISPGALTISGDGTKFFGSHSAENIKLSNIDDMFIQEEHDDYSHHGSHGRSHSQGHDRKHGVSHGHGHRHGRLYDRVHSADVDAFRPLQYGSSGSHSMRHVPLADVDAFRPLHHNMRHSTLAPRHRVVSRPIHRVVRPRLMIRPTRTFDRSHFADSHRNAEHLFY